jgi:predicted phosphodiesterase
MPEFRKTVFDWFELHGITTREELRSLVKECIVTPPIGNMSILEGFFAEYKKELKGIVPIVESKKVVCINDVHVPFQNNKMIENFVRLIEEEQPDEIILNGDMVDFYDLSSFDKDPAREESLQDELDTLYRMLLVFRGACPNAKITYVEGNHEDRLRRYLWKKATALQSLRSLKLETLLKLDELGIELVKKYVVNGFTFAHGKIVRQYSSYSAKAEYDARGCSGMSGHTHRMGSFCKTTSLGTFGWWENGCGCDLTPEYVDEPNWQNGFSVIYFDDNAFDVHQVYVNKGSFRFNGKRY